MKSLKDFLFNSSFFDGHVNDIGEASISDPDEGRIHFAHTHMHHPTAGLEKKFDEFFKGGYKGCVCCIGDTPSQLERIMSSHKDKFSAIGEVKVFKRYIDRTEGSIIRTAKDFSVIEKALEYGLPIFFHFDITEETAEESEIGRMKSIIHDHPDVKFVWCHCGMNELDSEDFAHQYIRDAMKECPNLYCGISWAALRYYCHPRKLAQLDTDRIIIGSDMSRIADKVDTPYNNHYLKQTAELLFHRLPCSTYNIKRLMQKQ